MCEPLVSVVIPAYNHENFISECLLSVVNQTYKKIEIIVIDDGSSDKTKERIEEFLKQHKNSITFIKQKNKGLIQTLNDSLEIINGDFVAFLASDDFWLPNKIDTQVSSVKNIENFSFVFSDCFFLYGNEKTSVLYSDYKLKLKKIISGIAPNMSETLLKENIVVTPTVMINRKILSKVGAFDGNLAIEDYDMWLRLAKEAPVVYINEPLAYYRLHNSNFSKKNKLMLKGVLDTHKKNLAAEKKWSFFKKATIKILFFLNSAKSKIKKNSLIKHFEKQYSKTREKI